MAVPTYEAMMRPTLEVLDEHGPQHFRRLAEVVAEGMQLTDDDRTAIIESGQAVYVNRAGWAVSYLVPAGAIRRPQRGVAEITQRGRQLLQAANGPISNRISPNSIWFQAFRKRRKRRPKAAEGGLGRTQDASVDTADLDGTPEEVIAGTVATVHGTLTGELLDRVMRLTPVAFETLVLRLLGAMKYGASGQIESTAASADAGIDGVSSQDPLGLDRIYVQAKEIRQRPHYRTTHDAGFRGALQGQQADRGVFITTCRFTSEALTYADRVGVQPDDVATLMKLDEDFFEAL